MLHCGMNGHRGRPYFLLQCEGQLDGKKRHPWTGNVTTPLGIRVSPGAGPTKSLHPGIDNPSHR